MLWSTKHVHNQGSGDADRHIHPDDPGVGAPLWLVSPTRTAAGYRLYDEQSIARLQAMRQLVEHGGWRPSQAAQRVLAEGSDIAQLV